jgi:hypothetical protein
MAAANIPPPAANSQKGPIRRPEDEPMAGRNAPDLTTVPAGANFGCEWGDGLRLSFPSPIVKPGWRRPAVLIIVTIVAVAATVVLLATGDPVADQWAAGTGLVALVVGFLAAQVVRTAVCTQRLYDGQVAALTVGSAEVALVDRARRHQRWPRSEVTGAAVRDCSGEDWGLCYQVDLTLADGSAQVLDTTDSETAAEWLAAVIREAVAPRTAIRGQA